MPKGVDAGTERTKKRVLAEYKKGTKPGVLAEKFGISVNTIKSWIRRDSTPKKKTGAKKAEEPGAAKRRRGAPAGNTNAVGNAGGPPLGSANALKHGGYSAVFWDTLTEEERALIEGMDYSIEEQLRGELALLNVRERRIMVTINKIQAFNEKAPGGMGLVVAGVVQTENKRKFDSEEDRQLFESIQRAKIDSGKLLPGQQYNVSTRTEATYDVLQRLEEALTRCQAQKQRCIQTLMELRSMKTEEPLAGDTREVEALIDAIKREADSEPESHSGNFLADGESDRNTGGGYPPAAE